MIDNVLEKLKNNEDLAREETYQIFLAIMNGEITAEKMTQLLISLNQKGETIEEIIGAAKAMRQKAIFIDTGTLSSTDIVGTGGDNLGTFNISTTATFVAAGAGVTIAKHGNRAMSSKSGAADLLAELGFNLETEPTMMEFSIQENGIGFLFAQKIHPAMKYAAPIRRALKQRTIFNLLGPLTNPSGARNHVIGVFAPEYTEVFAEVLRSMGSKRALVVHGLEGLDEISCVNPTRISELKDGQIKTYEISPDNFFNDFYTIDEIIGGTPEENKKITLDILNNKVHGAKRAIVVINAAAAIYVAGLAETLQEGIKKAEESLNSGAAILKMRQLIEASK